MANNPIVGDAESRLSIDVLGCVGLGVCGWLGKCEVVDSARCEGGEMTGIPYAKVLVVPGCDDQVRHES
jgi:hypothetical protein